MKTYSARLMVEGNIQAGQAASIKDKERDGTKKVPLDVRRIEQIDQFFKQGSTGVAAAEDLLHKLHHNIIIDEEIMENNILNDQDLSYEDRLTKPKHYFAMIDQFVNKADDTTSQGNDYNEDLMKALYWYRLGKPKRPDSESSENSTKGIQQIDTSNAVRGVATMKVIDGLLQLRQQWMDSGAGNNGGGEEEDLLSNIHIRTRGATNKGAVLRTFKNQFTPAISSTINENGVCLNQEDLLAWMKNDQAKEWSKQIESN